MHAPHTAMVFVALLAVWLLLSDGAPSSLLIGVPAVLAATWASLKLRPASNARLSPLGVLRFVPFFIVESVRGGIDVARRVFSPTLDVDPGFEQFQVRLPHQAARLLFTNTVSLLPGTLAADLHEDVLTVHALDTGTDLEHELRRVEDAVRQVFGAST